MAGKYVVAAGEMVKFDFSGVGFYGRLVMMVHILLGRAFLFDGIDIYDDKQ